MDKFAGDVLDRCTMDATDDDPVWEEVWVRARARLGFPMVRIGFCLQTYEG